MASYGIIPHPYQRTLQSPNIMVADFPSIWLGLIEIWIITFVMIIFVIGCIKDLVRVSTVNAILRVQLSWTASELLKSEFNESR